jgi:hypothetical protein
MHPIEFQLPEDVRTFFKDGEIVLTFVCSKADVSALVNTDSRGFYVDNSQVRHGRLE